MPTDKIIIMKSNELRIGNYVMFNNFIQPEKTVIVDGRFLLPFNKTDSEINNYYQPIPLTEDWLIKLDFEKSSEYWIKSNSSFFFGITTNGELMFLFDDALTCPANIRYVHQLQNVFFALTGNELTNK